jgi:hypothetical protein
MSIPAESGIEPPKRGGEDSPRAKSVRVQRPEDLLCPPHYSSGKASTAHAGAIGLTFPTSTEFMDGEDPSRKCLQHRLAVVQRRRDRAFHLGFTHGGCEEVAPIGALTLRPRPNYGQRLFGGPGCVPCRTPKVGAKTFQSRRSNRQP